LSANTSFVDFPRVCRLLARDGYLPRDLAAPGRRLVNSVGIVWLAVGAGVLLTVFGGITDRLIPLFAVGAFLAFTLSQSGMAVHWWRQPREGGRHWLNHGTAGDQRDRSGRDRRQPRCHPGGQIHRRRVDHRARYPKPASLAQG
jgi:amino acid transporter